MKKSMERSANRRRLSWGIVEEEEEEEVQGKGPDSFASHLETRQQPEEEPTAWL